MKRILSLVMLLLVALTASSQRGFRSQRHMGSRTVDVDSFFIWRNDTINFTDLKYHEHVEADITDLDKYTQSQVDTKDQAVIDLIRGGVAPEGDNLYKLYNLLLDLGKPLTFADPISWNASSGNFPSETERAKMYFVTIGGTVDGVDFAPGDYIFSLVDNPSTTTYADNWFKTDNSEAPNILRSGDLVTSFLVNDPGKPAASSLTYSLKQSVDALEATDYLQLGETSTTAYRGDRGKVAYDHAISPHNYKPDSYIPTWSEITSRPETATRWATWDEVTGKPTGVSAFANDAGYLTSYTESDPVWGAEKGGYVPYVGATQDLDLGNNNFIANEGLFNGILKGKALRTIAANEDFNLISRTGNPSSALYVQNGETLGDPLIADFRYGSTTAGQGNSVFNIKKSQTFANSLFSAGTLSTNSAIILKTNGQSVQGITTTGDIGNLLGMGTDNYADIGKSSTTEGVKLYFKGNNLKLETTSDGIAVNGTASGSDATTPSHFVTLGQLSSLNPAELPNNIAYTDQANIFTRKQYIGDSTLSTQLNLTRDNSQDLNTTIEFGQLLGNSYLGVNSSGAFGFNTSADLSDPIFKVSREGALEVRADNPILAAYALSEGTARLTLADNEDPSYQGFQLTHTTTDNVTRFSTNNTEWLSYGGTGNINIKKPLYSTSSLITEGNLTSKSNIQGTLNTSFLKDIIVDVNPESNTTVIPFLSNDLAFLTKRGGSVEASEVIESSKIESMFDCTPSYASWTGAMTDLFTNGELVLTINFHRGFAWGNRYGISFGTATWRPQNVKIELFRDDTQVWETVKDITDNAQSIIAGTHGTSGYYIRKMRITLSGLNSTHGLRINQIWFTGYNSGFASEGFVTRAGGDVYGNLTADGYIVNGGTSSQFLKGDGTLDSNTYATSLDLDNHVPYIGATRDLDLGSNDLLATKITSQDNDIEIPNLGDNGGQININTAGVRGLIGGNVPGGDFFMQVQRLDGTPTAYDLLLQPNGGNVGIGTTSPSEKLHVNGNILANSIKVNGGAASQFLKADGSLDNSTYLTSYTETDPIFSAWDKDYNDLINVPSIPSGNSIIDWTLPDQGTIDASNIGDIISEETDPVWTSEKGNYVSYVGATSNLQMGAYLVDANSYRIDDVQVISNNRDISGRTGDFTSDLITGNTMYLESGSTATDEVLKIQNSGSGASLQIINDFDNTGAAGDIINCWGEVSNAFVVDSLGSVKINNHIPSLLLSKSNEGSTQKHWRIRNGASAEGLVFEYGLNIETSATEFMSMNTSGVEINGTGKFAGYVTHSAGAGTGLLNIGTYYGYKAGDLTNTNNTTAAFGVEAGDLNTTGSDWTAIGAYAGDDNTSGSQWTAIGRSAGSSSVTNGGWTAIGYAAGVSNTGGLNWTAIGKYAGDRSTTGDNWIAIGNDAATQNQTGSNWIAIGTDAAESNDGSGGWVAIGTNAAKQYSNGSPAGVFPNGVFIGYDARPSSTSSNNEIVIGYQSRGQGANTVQLGNSLITKVHTYGNFDGDAYEIGGDELLLNGLRTSQSHTAGQVFTSNGTGAQPTFQDLPSNLVRWNVTPTFASLNRLGTANGENNLFLGDISINLTSPTNNLIAGDLSLSSLVAQYSYNITATDIASTSIASMQRNMLVTTASFDNAAVLSVNNIVGDNIANNSTGYVIGNTISIASYGLSDLTGDLRYNVVASNDAGDGMTGYMKSSLLVGEYVLTGVSNEEDINNIVAVGTDALRNSTATDLDYSIAIGYQAGENSSNSNPALFGRDAQPTADKQVVLGSSYYTGGVLLDAKTTIDDVLNIKPRTSAPSTGELGDIYVNSTDNHIYFHNGTAWVQMDN